MRYVLVEPPNVPADVDLVCHAPRAHTRSVPLVRARDQEVHDVLHVCGLALVGVGPGNFLEEGVRRALALVGKERP